MNYPKILIVSRLVWDDNSTSNTLTNLFEDYPSNKLARIYIETKVPNTKCCQLFYQISEISLVKKLIKWNIKTGRIIDLSKKNETPIIEKRIAEQENKIMNFVRGNRFWIFAIMREILWSFNGWKTKELKKFIIDFNPDIVWLDGSPLILMNRLNKYVRKIARKPSVTFLMDDVYNYKSCTSIWDKLYKYILRKHVKDTISNSMHIFVASPKMKNEYDKIFHINSSFITKSLDTFNLKSDCNFIHNPIKLIYLGNLLIGRFSSIVCIAQCVKDINKDGLKAELWIYTNDIISENKRKKLLIDEGIHLMPPIPYSKVSKTIKQSDIQIFVESFNRKHRSIARLSFSTKIVDYLASGKCILAFGPDDIAPIEYLKDEDAALIVTSKKSLNNCMVQLLDEKIIMEYSEKAVNCIKRNHDKKIMNDRIFSELLKLHSNYIKVDNK